jgi:hypothetical protein
MENSNQYEYLFNLLIVYMISIQIDMYYHAFHELYGNHECLVASLGLKQARLLTLLPNFCCNESI